MEYNHCSGNPAIYPGATVNHFHYHRFPNTHYAVPVYIRGMVGDGALLGENSRHNVNKIVVNALKVMFPMMTATEAETIVSSYTPV